MGSPGPTSDDNDDVDFPTDSAGETPPRYLFAVDGERPKQLLPLVCDIVADAGGELVIGMPVVLPEQTSLEAPEPRRKAERDAANLVMAANQECDQLAAVRQVVIPGHDRGTIIQEIIERYTVTELITEDHPRGGLRGVLGLEGVDETAATGRCDTIIASRIGVLRAIDSILVPVARGPHSGLAIDTALALARQNDADIEILHVTTPDDKHEVTGDTVLKTGMERLADYEGAERTLLDAADVPTAIIEYADPFDITILGAPREGLLRQFILETVPEEVSTQADGTVLIAHSGGAHKSWLGHLL